ncbi:hypothetical protein BJB45_07870 [Halomonas huangheensis]|uniref:Uncharacterized protein n=1 Tax=Halomonas huangheensis TaxID=1178482 RepID=W1N124_9GAMM|nr:hypothetical protein BJB45_07870 [Halomonas huangheensis]
MRARAKEFIPLVSSIFWVNWVNWLNWLVAICFVMIATI